MSVPGKLYVVAAPSGAGKSSLVNALVEQLSFVRLSVSHTTRNPRPGEVNAEHYYFVSESEFLAHASEGAFLEYAKVFDHYYGTSQHFIESQLAQGFDVILEIDWQGAAQVRRLMPECECIYIMPPSRASLLERLQKREQDSSEVIERRMNQASEQMSHYGEFDYLVVNDDFSVAVSELAAILISNRLSISQQQQRYQHLINDLLNTPS